MVRNYIKYIKINFTLNHPSIYLTFLTDNYENLIHIWTYIFVYNLALCVLFFTLLQFLNIEIKTLHSFSNLGATNILTKVLLISIFSMAGIPPFLGFFTKMFIFIILTNSNLFILFFLFFTILFVSLYFYIQNVRFLNSLSPQNLSQVHDLQLRCTPLFFLVSFTCSSYFLLGFFLIEDLILYFEWIFV